MAEVKICDLDSFYKMFLADTYLTLGISGDNSHEQLYLHFEGECNVHSPRSTSGATPVDVFDS